jgi:hypothetical protein
MSFRGRRTKGKTAGPLQPEESRRLVAQSGTLLLQIKRSCGVTGSVASAVPEIEHDCVGGPNLRQYRPLVKTWAVRLWYRRGYLAIGSSLPMTAQLGESAGFIAAGRYGEAELETADPRAKNRIRERFLHGRGKLPGRAMLRLTIAALWARPR